MQELEEEKVDSIVKESKFQGGKGGQARRASLGDKGNMGRWVDAKLSRTICRVWFYSKSG